MTTAPALSSDIASRPPPAASLTLADELARIAPGQDLEQLCRWPPDAFAFTATVLADSGAYRCIVNPPPGRVWPLEGLRGPAWEEGLRREAAKWAECAAAGEGDLPAAIRQLCEVLTGDVALADLDRRERWDMLVSLVRLHGFADEACAGAGIAVDTPFRQRAHELLERTRSLSLLTRDRVRVLPKLRPPSSGMTLRSLSHHVALDRSEVDTRWVVVPPPSRPRPGAERLTLLLLPHPAVVRAGDFVPVRGPLANMDESRFGFYEYAPQERFDLAEAVRIVEGARRAVGGVDVLVLPEGALDEAEVPDVQRALADAGVPYLISGVRQAARDGDSFGGNYAYFGSREWQAPPQHKHHRWCLDPGQVHQYHLGAALDPDHQWWEAIALPRRCLTFVTIFDRLTICPLVCEDLARPDPVTDVVRSIAPTLVVGLLLDGPQLAARWPARYASVLADDPGCSVLTLTALGMTQRSLPPGRPPSRAIALWKDPRRGLQELVLADGARALALTAHARSVRPDSADGRTGKEVAELVLSGIEQIT